MQNLSKILKAKKLLLVVALAVYIFVPGSAKAHDLLPKAIVEYLATHPNATPEEIQNFARTETPEFGEKLQSKEDVVRLVTARKTTFFSNLWDFIKLGIDHILSGPDHILFVLTLVLVFLSLKEILTLTGTFTLAHSITLVLAGTGLVLLPTRVVEPIIALSIACVAVTSVFLKSTVIQSSRAKIALVFFFGLFHGLGFAGLLEEIQIPPDRFFSSLAGFNIGIELGQLIILALVLPLIYYFKDKIWYAKAIKVPAVAIISVSLFWFIERIFF
jgi:hypothetical protein